MTWTVPGVSSEPVRVANVLVTEEGKVVVGRDAANGRVLWRKPLPDPEGGYSSGDTSSSISNGEAVWLDGSAVLCITRDGKPRWHRSAPFTGKARYADGKQVVTEDPLRIFGYTVGALPPFPHEVEEKRALAKRLASQFENLDDAERKQLGCQAARWS